MIEIVPSVQENKIVPGDIVNLISPVTNNNVIASTVQIVVSPEGLMETQIVPLETTNEITATITVNKTEPVVQVNTIDAPQIIYGGTVSGGSGEVELQLIKQAAEDIVAFKVVAIINNLAVVGDSSDLTHIFAIRGIAVNSVLAGGNVTIKTEGELTNGSWNWNMNQGIWFTSNGSLTQVKPVIGFGQVVAEPISATRIYVKLRHPVRND